MEEDMCHDTRGRVTASGTLAIACRKRRTNDV